MMKCLLSILIAASILIPSLGSAEYPYAKKKPSFPSPKGYVSDFAELFDDEWNARIRGVCRELETRTGVEMIVVTIPTVKPFGNAQDYAQELYKTWRIGTAQQERGMLLLTSLKEQQSVVVLGRSLIPVIGKPQLDTLSKAHLIPMFQNAKFGESIFQTVVGLAAIPSNVTKESLIKKKQSSKGFWMAIISVVAMIFALWRFTRPDKPHPFQRWRKGEYWSTGQGGFGGSFGGFGGGTSGHGLS